MRKLFENITKISVGTWVRGILSLVSIINMALTAFGKTPVSVEYSELYTIISLIFTFIVGAASYWKNNSFTSAAIEADKFMHEQRIAEGEDDNGTSLLYNEYLRALSRGGFSCDMPHLRTSLK